MASVYASREGISNREGTTGAPRALGAGMVLATLGALLLSMPPAVELLTSIDGSAPKPGWAYARQGQRVTLHARVKGGEVAAVRWFKLEPTVGALDNTSPSFHFAPVSYQATPLPGCDDRLECPADVVPYVLPAVGALPNVGSMAFQVRATLSSGQVLETPGRSSTRWGGLAREVLRVVVRRDDTLIGYATELFNAPYIFGSAGPDGRNQSDLLIGSDCADLVIYARRRGGHRASYTSSYAIDQQAPPLPQGAPVRAGDILHFPASRHVALLYEDRAPMGVLNPGDLILHTCWAPPTVQPLGEARCVSEPVRTLRFPN
jgi:hypothetical protein